MTVRAEERLCDCRLRLLPVTLTRDVKFQLPQLSLKDSTADGPEGTLLC